MVVNKQNSKLESVDTFERDQVGLFVICVVLFSGFIGLISLFEGLRRFESEGYVLVLFGLILCGFAVRYQWYARKPAIEVSNSKILVRRLLLPSHQINPRDVTKVEVQLHQIRPRGSYVGYLMIEYVLLTHRKGKVTQFVAPQFLSNKGLLDSLQLRTGVQVDRLPMVEPPS